MKKILLTLLVFISVCLSTAVADNAVTGNNGDQGDPNNAVIAAATNRLIAQEGAQPVLPAPAQDTVTPSNNALTNALTDTGTNTDTNTDTDAQNITQSTAQTNTTQNNTDTANNSADQSFGNTSESQTAFTQVLRNLIPLTPDQIITLRHLFDQSQQAATQYPGTPPKPTSSSIIVNMSPGAAPPVIRLRSGYVTSLVFLDSTGQPWPVVGYDLGDPSAFNIQPNTPDGKSNTLIIQAQQTYQQGNLAVMLKGESTPVMITLMTGQHAVDYRVDLRIPGLGPNAIVGGNGMAPTENPVLLTFLDGVAPDGAKLLDVEGAAAQAWSYEGQLYVRTRVTILSPGWVASMNSPDGTHVYQMMKTPVILASNRGSIMQLSIKGF